MILQGIGLLGGTSSIRGVTTTSLVSTLFFSSSSPPAHAALVWHRDPVNKRSGVQVSDAERAGYNVAFCTYLTRFLLTFDRPTQQYFFQQQQQQQQQKTTVTSSTTTAATTTTTRLFAQLAASVEIGLQSYTDPTGPARLLYDLSARYGLPPPSPVVVPSNNNVVVDDDDIIADAKKLPPQPPVPMTSTAQQRRRQQREAQEAQRQLALLFALLEERQPVTELTQLLAALDNGKIVNITLLTNVTVTTAATATDNKYDTDAEDVPPPAPAAPFLFTMGDSGNNSTTKTNYYAIIPPPPTTTTTAFGENNNNNHDAGRRRAAAAAQAQPVFTRTGRIYPILDVVDGGSGYSVQMPPSVQINNDGVVTTIPSRVTIQGGRVTKVELLVNDDRPPRPPINSSNGTTTTTTTMMMAQAIDEFLKGENDHRVTIVRADDTSSDRRRRTSTTSTTDAVVRAVPELALSRIDVTFPGSGYLVEKPVRVYLTTDPSLRNATADEIKALLNNNNNYQLNGRQSSSSSPVLQLVGKAFPKSERSSYTSYFRSGISTVNDEDNDDDDDETVVVGVKASTTGPDSGLPPLPFWTEKSSSSDLLRLLPAGIGLEYDRSLKRYVLAVDPAYQKAYPTAADFLRQPPTGGAGAGGGGRPLGPEFGPRGRAPIEKNMEYSTDVLLRFALSGAICSSAVHVALTPLDVVKTKVQTNPDRYPTVPISFGKIYRDEGLSTFYSGWLPTLLGNFIAGGALYLLTEVIRKYLTEAIVAAAAVGSITTNGDNVAATYEVPIILAAAATASAVGAMIICPFEAVRIRGVAQPDYGANSLAVLQRMIREDGGWIALVNTIPVFLVKNVPYAMTKFTIFDLATERLFAAFPAAQEELRWSLLISLLGGILGGTAAAVVSNPADALISELKKSQKKTTTIKSATTTTATTSPPDNGTDAGEGPLNVAQDMWQRGGNGPRLFFKGLGLRMVFAPLVASLQFCLYDFVRFSLGIGPDDLKLYLDVLGGALAGGGPSVTGGG